MQASQQAPHDPLETLLEILEMYVEYFNEGRWDTDDLQKWAVLARALLTEPFPPFAQVLRECPFVRDYLEMVRGLRPGEFARLPADWQQAEFDRALREAGE